MDRVEEYRTIICALIRRYAAIQPAHGEIVVEAICDEANDHYALMYSGWIGWERIHGAILHIDIRADKVWIEHDGTEDGVAEELVTAGIPRDHIVLGFQPPAMRKYTEYALA